MTEDAKIPVEKVAQDVNARMTDGELMEKYALTAKQLRQVLYRLFQTGLSAVVEQYRRPVLRDDAIEQEAHRETPRIYLAFQLPVRDTSDPSIRGWATDISEKGFAVRGIEATPGKKSKFSLDPRKICPVGTILLEAVCQWARTDPQSGTRLAGFKVVNISPEHLREFRNFIRFITVG
ncbi:MAG: PilZ domain-containing protein [Thermodesulfobacteriota bacterium]